MPSVEYAIAILSVCHTSGQLSPGWWQWWTFNHHSSYCQV